MADMRISTILILAVLCVSTQNLAYAQSGAARVVTWQPHAAHEFEAGYRRHLDWHRQQQDPWHWYGWFIVTGERTGWFIDGTFFHERTDFDHPIAPVEDRADNEINVEPHARLAAVVTYESVPDIARNPQRALISPFLSFVRLYVAPGREREFEHTARKRLQEVTGSHLLLRPVSGSSAYLLLIAAQRASEIHAHAELIDGLKRDLAATSPLVDVQVELGRYREDLSYRPPAKD